MNNNPVSYYNDVCQASYPEDYDPDDTHPPVTSFPVNFDKISATPNTIDHGNTGDSTPFQGNPYYCTRLDNVDTMDGLSNVSCPPACYDQVETNTNSSCPLPESFRGYYPDMTNSGPTNNYLQHPGMIDNTPVAYTSTQMPPQMSFSSNVMNAPARTEYFVMKVEYTPLVRIPTPDIDKILATLESEKEP
ncbi:5827_t:CDS:1 [Paraglomus occultum]|uniref:5827_t:CDS:1 n=1 Tax=Paraglomus occultum TaxID=144539 RepID=A0A9N9GDL8_9GLOM|nr:5827_t:CDS:1 [Paraglomus occultum]